MKTSFKSEMFNKIHVKNKINVFKRLTNYQEKICVKRCEKSSWDWTKGIRSGPVVGLWKILESPARAEATTGPSTTTAKSRSRLRLCGWIKSTSGENAPHFVQPAGPALSLGNEQWGTCGLYSTSSLELPKLPKVNIIFAWGLGLFRNARQRLLNIYCRLR